jgi:hypothetical protein
MCSCNVFSLEARVHESFFTLQCDSDIGITVAERRALERKSSRLAAVLTWAYINILLNTERKSYFSVFLNTIKYDIQVLNKSCWNIKLK